MTRESDGTPRGLTPIDLGRPVASRLARASLACALALAACSPPGSGREPPPNVLLVTLDTTRADRLGAYGHAAARTPALDALAARGTLFENAYSPSPMTLPAHATLLTGLEPPEHGARVNGRDRLGEGIPTLAELLSARGYRTGAFVAAFVLDRRFGLGRGFERYDDDRSEALPQEVPEGLSVHRPGSRVVDAALAWLAEASAAPEGGAGARRPFFAWVHLYDAHFPYHAHPELAGTPFAEQASYDAGVAFVDLQVARLVAFLEERGLAESTLVVAVGDHGEGLGDHHEIEHGYLLNEEVLRVPWIVSLPGRVREGQRVAALVSLVDLFPTALDLLGVPAAEGRRGRSLAPALRGEAIASRPSYASTDLPLSGYGWSPMQSLTTPDWKYVRTPRPELYERARDRAELVNLAGVRPAELAAREAELAALEAGFGRREAARAELSSAEREGLAALGYVTGAAEPPERPEGLRDVKDMLPTKDLAAQLRRGQALDALSPADALEAARELVRQSPETSVFREQLGVALAEAGELEAAIGELAEAVRLDPGAAAAHHHLGALRRQRGERAEALAHYREALRLDPELASSHVGIGDVLADEGKLDLAAGHYSEALRLRPDDAGAHFGLASSFARRGKARLAAEHYAEAARLRPDFAAAHYELANLLRVEGDPARAVEHYEAALRARPGDADALNNLGVALADAGRPDEAKARYLEALGADPRFQRPHVNLANWYVERGQLARAIEQFEDAVELAPGDAETRNRFAWVLATHPEAGPEKRKRAVLLAEEVCDQTRRRSAPALDTLGAAYAAVGRFADATEVAAHAARIARATGREPLARAIEARQRLYEAGKAYRESEPEEVSALPPARAVGPRARS